MPGCPPRATTPSRSRAGTPTARGSSPWPPGRPGCSPPPGASVTRPSPLPPGTWHDALSDDEAVYAGAEVRLADLLAHRPVALLVKQA